MLKKTKLSQFTGRAKRKAWQTIVLFLRNRRIYHAIYRCSWHYHFGTIRSGLLSDNYFSARPNPSAGIGHQLGNWIAGYWFATQFNLHFAHIPFSTEEWECFLGFGEQETTLNDLIYEKGYRKVRLPLFNAAKPKEVTYIKKLINSYRYENVVFIAEQDQFYRDQYGVMAMLKQKFYHAKARNADQIIFSPQHYNIAVHVRRGDISKQHSDKDPKLLKRWQNNDYFVKVLDQVLANLETSKPVTIYLFSEGVVADFADFERFSNLKFCLEMSAKHSFLHMANADLLITSKSSFSYKPALLSNGIKLCPDNFWHGYPNHEDWIVVKEEGSFDVNILKSLVHG